MFNRGFRNELYLENENCQKIVVKQETIFIMKYLIKIAIVEDNSDIQELLLDIFTTQKNFSVTGVFDNKTSALKNLPLSKKGYD